MKNQLYNFRKVGAFLLDVISPFKWGVFVMFMVATFAAFDFSFRRYLLKNILDTASNYQGHQEVISFLVLPACLYIFMSLTVTTIYRIYGFVLDIKIFPLLRRKIADKCYVKLLSHDYVYFQDNYTGDLVHKLSNITEGVVELIKLLIDRFFGCCAILILSIYTLSFASPRFAIATSIWVMIFITVSIFCFRTLSSLSNNYSEYNAKVTASVADSLFNINSVKLFNNKSYERMKFFKAYKDKLLSERRLHKAYWFVWFVYGYSFDILQIISLYFLISGFSFGKITLGDFALVIGLNVAIVEFLNQLTNDLTRFSDHYGKVLNAITTIFTEAKIKDKPNAKELTVNNGSIIFDNVTFSYHSREKLFENLSLNIKPKEKVALVGFSGAGKSSFVSLLLRLFDLKSGEITIDNQSIANIKQDSIRKNIAIIPQDLVLFHGSILENIRYGKITATTEEVIEASKRAGIHDFIMSLPNGYLTIVGEKGLKLSGGEKQRVNIARAFLKNAPILILDEATNQLDSITESEIQSSLFKLIRHKTALVIAHRLSTLLHMDRILVFDKGKIIQEGTHQQLISQSGLYQEMWNSQTNSILHSEGLFHG